MATLDLSEKTYLLGLDPSFENFGLCIYNPSDNSIKLHTDDFFGAIDWLGKNVQLKKCVAVLENPALDSAVFGGLGICKGVIMQYGHYREKVGKKEWPLPPKVEWTEIASQLSIAFRMAQNVGQSKASGQLFAKLLEKHRVPTIQIAPSERDRADKSKVPIGMMVMPTKTTQTQFQTLTNFNGRCSEHARDACCLVWGKSFKWAEMMLMRGLEDKAAKTRQKSRDNRQAKAAQTIKEIPKNDRKFFNVVGNGEPGQRVEKVNGKFCFVND